MTICADPDCRAETDNGFNVTNEAHGGKDTLCTPSLKKLRKQEKESRAFNKLFEPWNDD